MTLFFKPFRAAAGIAQVFAGVATGVHLQADSAALKRSANLDNTLTVRVVEAFSNPQNRSEPPQGRLIRVIESGIGGVMGCGLRLAIVVAHQARDDGAFAPFQAGD